MVRLRAIEPTDGDAFLADGLDTEAGRHGDDIKLPFPADAMRERIERDAKRRLDSAPELQHNAWLAVESLASGALVGSVTVHGTDTRHRHFEYGIAIFRAAQGNGFAREAVALALRYYFRELGYHRANATVYEFNNPSLALHRSLGFREEGRLRQSLFTNGQFYDELLFGMLAEEFGPLESSLPPVPFAAGGGT